MYTIEYNLTRPDEDLVFGITVTITDYVRVEPNSSTWDSDIDYYGYEELNWDIIKVVCVDENGHESLVADIDSVLSDEEIDKMDDCITEKLYKILNKSGEVGDED